MDSKELGKWTEAKNYMGNERITLGPHYSYTLKKDPRRLLFILSHYKFATKLIGADKYILEVGCSEGFGTVLLGESAKKVMGVDMDKDAIGEAQRSFGSEKIEFKYLNFLDTKIDTFDAIVSFDVIEHIYPENEKVFFESLYRNLKEDGVCIVGTPNKTSEQYASATSKISHINLYTWDRLKDSMNDYFQQVFIFSANDETIHTGFYPMAHYLIGVGVCKKNSISSNK